MESTYLHDRVSVVLFPLIFIVAVAYYKTFVFGEQYVENYVERFDSDGNAGDDSSDLINTNDEIGWNWTLYATGAKLYAKTNNWEAGEPEIDNDLILEDVRKNFAGEKYKNVRENLRFSNYTDKIACPIYISNSARVKEQAIPDAIGIGFAKSGTGSLAMLRQGFNVRLRLSLNE